MFFKLHIDKTDPRFRSNDETPIWWRIRNRFANRYNWAIVLLKKHRTMTPIEQALQNQQLMAQGNWEPFDSGWTVTQGYAFSKRSALRKATKRWAEQFETPDPIYIAKEPKLRRLTDEELAYELMKEKETAQK